MTSLKILGVLVWGGILVCCQGKKEATGDGVGLDLPKKNFNLLLITIDTLRYDRLGINSTQFVQTPQVDALAKQAMVFSRAFAHNPETLPSHTNILTGTTPLYHGISDNTGYRLADRFITLAELLKAEDYRTAAFIGAFPLDSRFGLDQGFDHYDDQYGTRNRQEFFFVERPAEKVIQPAREWIQKQNGKWFSWIHLFDPHQPYQPPAPFDRMYPNDPYSGEMAYVDSQLGRLFNFLKSKGILDSTVVILTSDHGEALGEKGEETHSYFAYNNTIHVPLIVYIPGCQPQRITENVCHVDIFPTVCELLGLSIPSQIQGESLVAVMRGEKRKTKDIYFESMTAYLNRNWAPLQGTIRGDRKFIDQPLAEVYDLHADWSENNNLASGEDIGKWRFTLRQLTKKLENPDKSKRTWKVDAETIRKLRTLGYVAGSGKPQPDKVFSVKDDLKTMLPIQNKLLKGVGLYEAGDISGGIGLLKEVIADSPTFILGYNHLATILVETGNWDEAVSVLERGLKRNPGNIRLLANLGVILAENGDAEKAIDVLSVCIQRENFDPEHFNYLGIAYYRFGDFPKALQTYQRALELDPDYASVYNNIGSLYLTVFMREKRPRSDVAAVENFKKALELDPQLSSAYNGLGAIYKKMGKNDEALSCWQKALEIKPDFDLPWVNLGITYLETGRPAEALRYLLNYKEKFFSRLSQSEKDRVERLIAEARRSIR